MSTDRFDTATSVQPAPGSSGARGFMRAPSDPAARQATRRRNTPGSIVLGWVVALFVLLAFVPFRNFIPPLIESDYAYQLMAVERAAAGEGFRSLPPLAPGQPWEWQGDWQFLTQWPVGYPALVWAVRQVFQTDTLDACRWISVAACALAVVGWFLLIKRVAPGIAGGLLAAVAAGHAVTVGFLIDPSTDAIIVALLPYIAITVLGAVPDRDRSLALSRSADGGRDGPPEGELESPPGWSNLLLGGLLSGLLVWVRYASVFVPAGIFLFLLVKPQRRRRIGSALIFGLAAAVPIIGLIAVNRSFAQGEPLQTQFNLGHRMGFDWSWHLPLTAWSRFTHFGFYDHRPEPAWISLLWPFALLATAIHPRIRKRLRAFLTAPAPLLSLCLLAAFFGLILAATTLFRSKYDFVGLQRYYAPVQPFYFLLFVTPLLLVRSLALRVPATAALLLAGSWIMHQEWKQPYRRQLASRTVATPYGQWSRCFEPAASELYLWLKRRAADDLVVVSNFHEFLALETGIPAVPLPPDPYTFDLWLERIRTSRRLEAKPRALFVLDPSNRWRDHWLPPPDEVWHEFGLQPHPDAPAVGAMVGEYPLARPLPIAFTGTRNKG